MHRQFRDYIERMSDGSIRASNGAQLLDTGEAFFPLDAYDATNDALRFAGTLEFTGHHGMLAVTVQNPRLQQGPTGTTMTIVDPFDQSQRMDLVAVELKNDGTGTTRLTEDGTDVFMGNYPVNIAFDPVRITWVGKD